MSVTYAGVELTDPEEFAGLIAQHRAVEDIYELEQPSWSGLNDRKPSYNSRRHIKLGRLSWPTGASRFAIGHFLATDAQLLEIRNNIRPPGQGNSASLDAQTLRIWAGGDATDWQVIETDLHLLPPRPLFQYSSMPASLGIDSDRAQNLWLLTLVDDRYFWWMKAASIVVDQGTTTWDDLISAIMTELAPPAWTSSAVDASYLKPHGSLTTHYGSLPALLDAVCYSIGRRCIRYLDGTVELITADEAATQRDELLDEYKEYTIQGGSFAFNRTSDSLAEGLRDTWAIVPASISMSSPQIDIVTSEAANCGSCSDEDATVHLTTVSTADTAILGNMTQRSGTKIIRSTAVRWMDGVTQKNDSELTTLLTAWAGEWIKWRCGDQYRMFPTVIPWDGDALVDTVEWETWPNLCTRIERATFNDMADTVYHATANSWGPGTCVSEISNVATDDIPGYSAADVQSLSHTSTGCLEWINSGYVWTDVKTTADSPYQSNAWEAVPVDYSGGNVVIRLPQSPALNERVLVAKLNQYPPSRNLSTRASILAPGNGTNANGENYINGVQSTTEIMGFVQTDDYGDDGYWEFVFSNDPAVGWVASRILGGPILEPVTDFTSAFLMGGV